MRLDRACANLPSRQQKGGAVLAITANGAADLCSGSVEAIVESGSESPSSRRFSMTTIKEAASEFLAQKRVAVTGVSRTPGRHGSNAVYKRLRERGYDVFAVNPNADEVEGDRAYRDLHSIPGGVAAVVIGTRPEIADETVRECAELGIEHVWMHRGPGAGSVSKTAADFGRARGLTVIDGGCPCMFGPTADPGHKVMRALLTLTGNVPKEVSTPGGMK
jgi:predicted CoA-binding protein